MFIKKLTTVIAISAFATSVSAGCAFENNIELKSLSNSFEIGRASCRERV